MAVNGLIYRYNGLRGMLAKDDYEQISLFKDEKDLKEKNSLLNIFTRQLTKKPAVLIYSDSPAHEKYRYDGDDVYFQPVIPRNYIDLIFFKTNVAERKDDLLILNNSNPMSIDCVVDIIPIELGEKVTSSSNGKIHKYNFKSLEWNFHGNHRYEIHHDDPVNAYLAIVKELGKDAELRLRRVKCPPPGTKYVKGQLITKEDRF